MHGCYLYCFVEAELKSVPDIGVKCSPKVSALICSDCAEFTLVQLQFFCLLRENIVICVKENLIGVKDWVDVKFFFQGH